MKEKIALFPGSFDPVHFGHIDIATRAAKIFDVLYVGVYAKPSKNILFSTDERFEMISLALADIPNIKVVTYQELSVNFAAQIGASVMVRGLRVFSDFEYEFRMALTNQQLNPQIETISLITAHEHTFISSSTVKEVAGLGGDVSFMVPPFAAQALREKLASRCEL